MSFLCVCVCVCVCMYVCVSLTGAVTVAVVPSWRGTPAQDVGVAYPDLPFPLELIALCMLRILQRKNHEGGLDASERFCLKHRPTRTHAHCRSSFSLLDRPGCASTQFGTCHAVLQCMKHKQQVSRVLRVSPHVMQPCPSLCVCRPCSLCSTSTGHEMTCLT